MVEAQPIPEMNHEEASEQENVAELQSRVQDLEKKVQELQSQTDEKEKKYVYLYAEFENFKKRVAKERSDLVKFGWEPAARELLQVIDNLERALKHAPAGTNKTLVEGLEMVLNQFKAALQKQGIEQIRTAEQPFDPNYHEAVGQEKSEHPEGAIVKEHQPGYTLHGRLLRPARVIVSAGKPDEKTGNSK